MYIFDRSSALSCTAILDGIVLFYGLDSAVTNFFELSYTTCIGNAGNTKEVKLANEANIFEVELRMDSNKNIHITPLTINDLKLKVRYNIFDKVDRDCLCGSIYMITAM